MEKWGKGIPHQHTSTVHLQTHQQQFKGVKKNTSLDMGTTVGELVISKGNS